MTNRKSLHHHVSQDNEVMQGPKHEDKLLMRDRFVLPTHIPEFGICVGNHLWMRSFS